MGGMTAAAMLADLGRRVLVLEQHYVPGGFTHMFKRPGYEWDVGVHAVGGSDAALHDGAPARAAVARGLAVGFAGTGVRRVLLPGRISHRLPGQPSPIPRQPPRRLRQRSARRGRLPRQGARSRRTHARLLPRAHTRRRDGRRCSTARSPSRRKRGSKRTRSTCSDRAARRHAYAPCSLRSGATTAPCPVARRSPCRHW